MSRRPSAGKRTRTSLACAALIFAAVFAPAPRTSLAAPTRSEVEAAEARLMELERDFQLVSERYNLVAERLAELQQKIGVLDLEVKAVESRINARLGSAVELARELYMSGPSIELESILSADSINDIETRLHYLQTTEQAHSRVFERLAVDKYVLDDKIKELELAQAKAIRSRAQLASLRDEIYEKVALQEDEVAELNELLRRAIERRQERRAAAAAAAAATTGISIANAGIARASNPKAQAAVDAALSQVGKPYQWGASGPDSYDCSGLTMWAWAHAGVSLPHNSGMQYSATARVSQSDWEPGDLLFFGTPIHHVGMYIGNGNMVEAPYTGQHVRINSAYRSDYVGAGRPGV